MERRNQRIKKLALKLNSAHNKGEIQKQALLVLKELKISFQLLYSKVKNKINCLFKERSSLFDELEKNIQKHEREIKAPVNMNFIEQQFKYLNNQVQNFCHYKLHFDLNSEVLAEEILTILDLRMEKEKREEQEERKEKYNNFQIQNKLKKMDSQFKASASQISDINQILVERLSSFPQASLDLAKSIKEFTRSAKNEQLKKENYRLVYKIFQSLSDKGDLQARRELAQLYLNGEGVKKNVERGISILEKLAQIPCKATCKLLATIYLNGVEVPQNGIKAAKYIQMGAEQGEEAELFNRLNSALLHL